MSKSLSRGIQLQLQVHQRSGKVRGHSGEDEGGVEAWMGDSQHL